MEEFKFEHTYKFSEKEYLNLMRILPKKNRWLRILIGVLIGIICLFWTYTLIIGVVLILFSALPSFMQRFVPGTVKKSYSDNLILHSKNLYGLCDKSLWLKNNEISITTTWKYIKVWEEKENWLQISSNSLPTFWFPINELKNEGIYTNVIDLCNKNAIKFGSEEAYKT